MADIEKELNAIKNAVYGREVRGAIHDGIKKINDEAENATDLSESAKHQVENIQQQVNQLVVEGDSSVEAAQARVDVKGHVYETLKQRLDTEYTEVMSKLVQIEQEINTKMSISEGATKQELRQKELEIKSYLDTQLSTIGSMTPKGAFATLQELKNEYPNGTEGIFLVQSDGHWYYWNGDDWTDGGLYQAMPWDEFMTEPDEEWVI